MLPTPFRLTSEEPLFKHSGVFSFFFCFISFRFCFLFFFTRRGAFTFSGELEIPFWSRKRRGGTTLPAAVYWHEDKLK